MIMGLCLLVYTLAQRQLHAALSAESGIKNRQAAPRLRIIFIFIIHFGAENSVQCLV